MTESSKDIRDLDSALQPGDLVRFNPKFLQNFPCWNPLDLFIPMWTRIPPDRDHYCYIESHSVMTFVEVRSLPLGDKKTYCVLFQGILFNRGSSFIYSDGSPLYMFEKA